MSPKAANKHSFVHQIQVASPCKMNWNDMEGDDRTRHCGACNLNVFNLASMTADEIETLFIQTDGRVCVRLFRRADGTVITKDCPVGLAARFRAYARRTGIAAGALIALLTGFVFNFRSGASRSTIWEQWQGLWHDASDEQTTGRAVAPGVQPAPKLLPAPSPMLGAGEYRPQPRKPEDAGQ